MNIMMFGLLMDGWVWTELDRMGWDLVRAGVEIYLCCILCCLTDVMKLMDLTNILD